MSDYDALNSRRKHVKRELIGLLTLLICLIGITIYLLVSGSTNVETPGLPAGLRLVLVFLFIDIPIVLYALSKWVRECASIRKQLRRGKT